MKPIGESEYTAFVSYAHADDTAHVDWVSHFCRELQRVLPAVARIPRLPPLHQSGLNGPVAGVLADELKANLSASFAMLIVVGESYLASEWCLRELEYFKERFGERGFRERLFVVAMAEPAMLALAQQPRWKDLVPDGDVLWLPFFRDEERGKPIKVYNDKGHVAPAFQARFERLVDEFAARLRSDVAAAARSPLASRAALPAVAPPARPATPATPATTPTTATPKTGPAPVLLGWCAAASATRAAEAAQALQARGLVVRTLGRELLDDDFAAFDGASALVLLVDAQPLMLSAALPGGHLQMQREAWLKRAGDPTRLVLLDTGAPADAPAAAWARQQGLATQALPDVLNALASAPAPAPAPVPEPVSTLPPVRIYIESNRHERTEWQSLGAQVQAKWATVAGELAPGQVPPLSMRLRGLPVDELDAFPTLDDADGVVLLWGKKTSQALVAQINKVEARLPGGASVAPGIVAYLMPPQASSEPVPAWGWQVLRFDASDQAHIDVVAEERDELKRFLTEVFARHRARHAPGRAAA